MRDRQGQYNEGTMQRAPNIVVIGGSIILKQHLELMEEPEWD